MTTFQVFKTTYLSFGLQTPKHMLTNHDSFSIIVTILQVLADLELSPLFRFDSYYIFHTVKSIECDLATILLIGHPVKLYVHIKKVIKSSCHQ